MMARSFGEIIAAAKPAKEFRSPERAKVWRNSYYENTIEKQIWRPLANGTRRGAKRHIGAVLKSARVFERRSRRERQLVRPGTRNGALGQIGLDVLEALYELVDFKTGRLEPAIATLAAMVGHSYAAVHAALRRLRASGFLHWVRRSRPTDKVGEAGPQVEQITNAYCLLVPEKIERIVKLMVGQSPTPADANLTAKERDQQIQYVMDQMTHRDFQEATWSGDNLAGETLKRIAALLDQKRESSRT
jgi:hypothetical protein